MKNSCCIIIFLAFLSLALSAPFREDKNEEVKLQGELEDEMISRQLALEEDQDSSAAVESRNVDTVLDVLQTVLNFAKEKNSQNVRPQGQVKKQKSFASTLQFQPPPSADQPHILPIDSPEEPSPTDSAEEPGTDMPRALPVNPLDDVFHILPHSPRTNRFRSSRTQTFLPQDVQDRYNRDDDSEMTLNDPEEAEVEAFGAILAGALKAFSAIRAIKSLLPQSGSKSGGGGSNSGSNFNFGNFGPRSGTSILDRLPSGRSRYSDYASQFLGFPGSSSTPSSNGPQNEELIADEQLSDEAEIERFEKIKSFLGKALRLLKGKMKPRNRSTEEDEQAVNRPTRWKDLGRNLLGLVGDNLDPTGRNPSDEAEEQVDWETEDLNFK